MSTAIAVLEKRLDPIDTRSALFAFVRPPGRLRCGTPSSSVDQPLRESQQGLLDEC
jgi:hypothetical protein